MLKRLNYTKRKKLSLSEVGVRVFPSPDRPAAFDVDLNLDALRTAAAGNARIFVEAYQQSIRMRFDWGTVDAPTPPPPDERCLTDFEDWRFVLFRVKITDTADNVGRIIAWCDRIRPRGPENQPSNDLVLFRNREVEGLLWDITFEDVGPVVNIDPRAGEPYVVGRDPRFIAAAYPEILRRILTHIFIEEDYNDFDEEHWSHQWLPGFLRPRLGIDEAPAPEDDIESKRAWIDDAVCAFARRNDIYRQWILGSEEH